ncbi:MAG: BsuPI-related putative proteinase inhibitor [Candidatus Hermodarchaeia archaeon]|jgi:hypothetical protein
MKKRSRTWLVVPLIIIVVIGGLITFNLIRQRLLPSEPEYTYDRNSLVVNASTNNYRYGINETIQIRIAMHNLNSSTLRLSFSSSLQVDYGIFQNSTLLFGGSWGLFFELWVTNIDIPPEGTVYATLLHHSVRYSLPPGDYELLAIVDGYQNVSIPIQVNEFTTKVTTDKNEIRVGEPFEITIEVFNPHNSALLLGFPTMGQYVYSIVGVEDPGYFWTTFYFHFDMGFLLPMGSTITIPPNSSVTNTWEHTPAEFFLPTGTYDIFAWVDGYGGNETRIRIV